MADRLFSLQDELLKIFDSLPEDGGIPIRPLVDAVQGSFLRNGFRKDDSRTHTRQILVLRLDELGDVILTSAFFRELRRNFPQARITAIVNPRCLDAVALSPYVNQVYALDTLELQKLSDRRQLFTGLLNFARERLWPECFDLCLSPRFDHDRYLAGMLALLSGARARVGYDEKATPWKQKLNQGFDAFYTRTLAGAGAPVHEAERNLALIRSLGGKVGSTKLEAWTSYDDEQWAEEQLRENKAPLVALSPGLPTSNRTWPLERYEELLSRLAKKSGLRAVVLGAGREIEAGNFLKTRMPEVVLDFCGRTSIRQMTAMLRRCRLYVGRDTSVMHLAAAAGIPIVEISSCPEGVAADYHVSSPVRFGPWGVPHRILRPNAADPGCAGGCRSNAPHCILNLSVEQVTRAVDEVLSLPMAGNSVSDNTTARRDTWTAVLRRFDEEQAERRKQNPAEAILAADNFYLDHLPRIRPEQALRVLPALTEAWVNHRRLPHRFGALASAERQRLADISERLRALLTPLLRQELKLFGGWSEAQQQQWVSLWRLLFLNPFSPLALSPRAQQPSMPAVSGDALRDSLLASLHIPQTPAGPQPDFRKAIQEQAPAFLKVILGAWMVGTPYFGVVEADRRRVCRNVDLICRTLQEVGSTLPFAAYVVLFEEIMAAFWRISYAGGDCSRELSTFGDLISRQMNHFFPQTALEERRIDPAKGKLRIGYISRNFCKQAVAFYMVNRIIHHDRSRFEVHTFAVGDRDDELTTVFKENSDVFERHLPLTDFGGMIRKLRESKLDMLIYADLGMDPMTLMLAGLRLAPVQCVLVGHGVTSGMPEIDYYISGDFEPTNAERFYREKLVRLPKLGAAQYPPFEPDKYPTRQDYKIPEDAVVYVSCANGIKIHPDQDPLWLEILRRVPNAWLLLKPFQTPDAVDPRFMERIFGPARAAGVAERVLIVPPFRQAKEVLGLLKLADIQLDTFPYGGWTTNMEAVYMGLPIVTQEGEMARSRWGAAMLRAMGIQHGIARTGEEYVEQAVRLGQDSKLRAELSAVIREKAKTLFFDGAAAQTAYENALVDCYNEKMGAAGR